jgi:hypothetical protein
MTPTDATGWSREQHADADVLDTLDEALGGEFDRPIPYTLDEARPDYPMHAVLDMIESAIVTVRTVEDQLREHSRGLVPSAATEAWDTLVKGAYLRAEHDATSALAVLQHAAQLVKGLAS